ncbi:MAG TPA: adenylate/guanylate cyclase domain-containing protein [Chitinophagaceae bacterium]|nr:adenylate/guanylate cyclase domain-containing protein [Chitinophagaceae bacterium]
MKLTKHLFFLLLIFISFAGFSQDRTADSLKMVLLAAKNDTIRVKALLELSSFYLDSSPEDAKSYGVQALNLAQKINYHPGRALALKFIGSAYYFLGNTPATLEYYGQALQIFDSLGDLINKCIILNNFGTVYYMNGTDDKALDSYFKSLDIAEKIGDKAGIATAYSNIANVYHNKRATTGKALDFFLKALHISEDIGDKNIIGAVSVNLGEIYSGLNKEDSALLYYYKSVVAYSNTINLPVPLRGIGLVYAKKGDFKNAIQYNEQSYQMARKLDSKLAMTQSLVALGNVYIKTGDFESALSSYQEADSIASIIPAYKELDSAYAGLAATYSKMGDFGNAYKYQKLFSSISDTLNNQTLADKLTSLQRNFEIQTRQNEINLLTKDKKLQELELRSQKTQKYFITAALVLIFIIAFGIYRNYRSKVKTNIILDRQKAEIEGLLLNILPSEVAAELQQNGQATPRYFEKVSVLFTDFKGFTLIADSLSPQQVVSELNACFKAFDDIIEKYNLEKIKTIGDSYMCAGGIPTEDDGHPLKIIKAGLEIRDWMNEMNQKREEMGQAIWELRIGIHVGPVVAGVVGKKKYAYDIWGSTVNIASRMESNGHPGLVNISAATYDLVKDHYLCIYRGKVMAKNIGEIDMYFVDKQIV